MNLPKNEFSFNFSIKGERTKHKYEGGFTVKCLLSTQEIIEVGLRLDTYNRGSNTLPAGVQRLNRALAELEVRMVKAPSWWKDSDDGRNLMDTNVVFELFVKALDAEADYDKRIIEMAGEAEASMEEKSEPKAKTK